MNEQTPSEKLPDILMQAITASVPLVTDRDPLNSDLLDAVGSLARAINRYFCAENRIRIKRRDHV